MDYKLMKTTIRDIAKAANVSVATVSLALNNRAGVNHQTRANILRITKEMHYVPNQSARSLVMNDSGFIGLVVPEIINPFYSSVVDIITNLAEEKGYTILLGISNNKVSRERACIKTFASRNATGVIIVPMLKDDPDTSHLDLLSAGKIPMVFCTEYYPEWISGEKGRVPCVMTDFVQGEHTIIKYLISKGMKNICLVSSDSNMRYAQLRMRGYELAHEEAGLEFKKENLFLLKEPSSGFAYEVTDEVLKRKPDAIVCINDFMTLGIMKRLYERKIRIPEEISIAGFDDVVFAELTQQRITTVRQPLMQICQKTMEILERKIKGTFTAENEELTYFIKPELIIRDTTI